LNNIEFHIIGTGKEENNYKNYSEKLNINSICFWHGYKNHDDVLVMMNESDILLFTSLDEGTPHVVLEALSASLPVICHDACGQSSVINAECGIKIKVKNPSFSRKEFSRSILNLSKNKEILNELSIGAKKRAEKLSWFNKAKQLVNYYENVVVHPEKML